MIYFIDIKFYEASFKVMVAIRCVHERGAAGEDEAGVEWGLLFIHLMCFSALVYDKGHPGKHILAGGRSNLASPAPPTNLTQFVMYEGIFLLALFIFEWKSGFLFYINFFFMFIMMMMMTNLHIGTYYNLRL